ncbi:dicarboxylate/amino acid:cation symporter [Micromonospora cathayae]|uniref:Dicarboxylate/amino acid:cation symporter n=1 Tax=Micromonospora cathayae TaxID=3028804 RepID=A0ABY7ZYS2_9ACTN|nr:dicarboxylate/amino acid:cation symporter [Micromonospora sp. HUAS 3]WDZ88050.1 dicarboxylate/amino acid:cation symporter [Micromonospora sp. HUAS 3]
MRRIPFSVQILLGLVLGVALGFVARATDQGWLTSTLDTVGGLFVQLLKLAVPPLVFTAIVVSVVSLRGVTNAARLAGKTLLWFGVTALLAVGVGIGLGLLTDPGRGVTLDTAAATAPERTGSWTDFLTGIVPTNPVGAFVEGNVLQIVFLALVVGAAALLVGEPAEPFVALNRSLLEIVQKALWWVIRLAPLGTLGLIGNAVATYGWDLLAPLATFTTAVYVGCAIVLLVIYPVVLLAAGRLNPLRFYAGAWPAIELAFVSRSSVGTLPVTQRSVERLGVPREYASFAVPFGATTKMDGCAAVYPALAAIFVAQVFGVDLGVTDYLLIAFVSVVGSAATAGLTGAIVMLTLTLSTLGLPLAGAGLLLAIDPILDMIRTATNVAGQALVPTVVAAREGILDRSAYDAAGRRDLTEPVGTVAPAAGTGVLSTSRG